MFEVPASLIDLRSLPPPILTSKPGSFAYNTFKVRIPRIVEETIAANSFPTEIEASLWALRAEITGGRIRGLQEATPDRAFWDAVSSPYIGRSWLDVPWYWAEAFFYRRVLEATRYFQPGPWQGRDPYHAIKQTEWEPGAAPQAVNAMLQGLPSEPRARFQMLLYASLWGNRTDLSYNVAAQIGQMNSLVDERVNLLVDDSARVWQFLQERPHRRWILITDNAGTELLMDLALADFLLEEGEVAQIILHLKPQPFFVSDAMSQDVEMGVRALTEGSAQAQALGQRVQRHLASGRLQLHTHWFYATSLFYFQLPIDLHSDLAASDLVLLKGDVNYRRLLGDAQWPLTTPFEQAVAYFPTSCVALRTFKAELAVGLRPGEAERLYAQDPEWMVNGRRGVVQAKLPGVLPMADAP
ncbi:MAG: damage-control phosphatase ARMT1 family protein [Anaerolineae bacterium]|nr:damage-control phosphatase ARMT1 family protein [Anaerolineae bacterium]MDW8098727.1 damage-control phosphatase ARMT1 family protein [Anaerolineae bacterium]